MNINNTCPCCGAVGTGGYPALIASFILSYVLNNEVSDVKLLVCNACQCRWFNSRYEDEELERLYKGYRGDAYFRVRHKYEPWYTAKANKYIGYSDKEITKRKKIMVDFIKQEIEIGNIDKILDYGGDKGQFIPENVGKNKVVYELSGVAPVTGVEAIAEEGMLSQHKFDFIMVCHVLEHVPDPKSILEQIGKLLSSEKSWLYIEVPYEIYGLSFVPKNRYYNCYLKILAKTRYILMVLDFYSTLFRIKAGFIPPLGFIKMHEHINFFTKESFFELLRKSGFEIKKCEIISKNIHILARKV